MKQPDLDMVIVGAGLSGIGAAHHLQEQLPDMRFAILEASEGIGGTWRIHTYPGIRSDSDLYTFGFRFKPWTDKPIAEAHLILEYLNEVVDEDGLRSKIRFHHRLVNASWSNELQVWRLLVQTDAGREPKTITTRFLWNCPGYYKQDKGYTPTFKGLEAFRGRIVHPQNWPNDLDVADKRVLVIGSGATAATLIPKLAETAAHVTMLQRSPTYFWSAPNRNLFADILRGLKLPDMWVHQLVRKFNLTIARMIQDKSRHTPEKVRKRILDEARARLPEGFDVETHFGPSYRPWQQRLAFLPEGDLFASIRGGNVSIVTDCTDRFVESGVVTGQGDVLEADIIVTATGFDLSVMGGIHFDIDGAPVDFSKATVHRGVMLSGVPNFFYVFGYLRTSWTMRVDLVSDYVIRILRHVRSHSSIQVTPTFRTTDDDMPGLPLFSEDEFNPGYIKRSAHLLPKQGDRAPWTFEVDYYKERKILPSATLDDGTLVLSPAPETQRAAE